jgi:4-hydroxybutyrate CoA-transferase
VILPHGCAEPRSLYAAFREAIEELSGITLVSGLSFGEYSFLERGLGDRFRYATWQASPKIRSRVEAGQVEVLPIRYGDLPRVIRPGGVIEPDVVIVQVSPPRREGGPVNLGVSVGVHRSLVDRARLVIAELNPQMPWTAGASVVPADRIDLAVEADAPLAEYRTPPADERERRIVDLVLDLVPDGAWVQLGVGAVPDRVLERLGEKRDVNLFSGLLTGGLMAFLESSRHDPRVTTGELAGTTEFYRFCHRNRRVRMERAEVTHDVCRVSRLPRFVSINSALEVDLEGQVNGERIDGVQLSGVGGSLDYMEAAFRSEGGLSIVALPSTTRDGDRSRIVPWLGPGSAVTAPRHCVDVVVTEYGVARLRGRSVRARAEALIAIAAPGFRDELAQAAEKLGRVRAP